MTTNGDVIETNGNAIPEITDQTCICSICCKTYKLPKVLPCLHTFCADCLETYIGKSISQNGQKSFQCPSCELQVEVPNGSVSGHYANAFPDDTFMVKLVESFNVLKEDKNCDICERREKHIPAVNWCMDCYDALCETCLKVHLHGKITSGHVVMSIDEMKKLPVEVVMKKKNKVPCIKHNEMITLFCVDCREPLCVQCMAVSHRRCENVITVADAMSSRSDVNDVMERLETLQLSLESADGLGQSEKILDDSISSARTRVISVCNSLCEKVREQQAELLRQLDLCEEEARKILKERTEPRKTGVKTVQSANERMKTLMRYGSDVEILLAYNQVKKQLDSCQGSLADVDMNSVKVQVNFALDETVNNFMQEFEKIGEVSVDAGSSDEGLSSWGVTYNSADDIIVTDCKNKRIQKFSKFGDLVDYVQLEDEPRDITTCYNNDDVAITMIGKLIIFLTTRKAMQLIKRAKTERQYDGICYSEREGFLLVTSVRERVVDAIRLDGTVIRTFEKDANSDFLFAEPRYVCGSPEGTIIVSDVTKNAIICLSADGRKLFEYKPEGAKALKKPQCVCVDKIGNIFLADHGNNRVQLLTNDGIFQREVLGEESGLEKPVALRVSNSNRMILVQSDGMVKVFSYA